MLPSLVISFAGGLASGGAKGEANREQKERAQFHAQHGDHRGRCGLGTDARREGRCSDFELTLEEEGADRGSKEKTKVKYSAPICTESCERNEGLLRLLCKP